MLPAVSSRCGNGAAEVERAVEVHRQVVVPVLVGHRGGVPHLVKAGRVDQDVEPAEPLHTGGDRVPAGLRGGDVDRGVDPPGTAVNTSAIRSASRAMPNTDAPRSANTCATAAPSPDDAPVTRGHLPAQLRHGRPFRRTEPGYLDYSWDYTCTLRTPTAFRSPEQL